MPQFTYDLATPIGQARLFAMDTDRSSFVFHDEEYTLFLGLFAQSPMLAAAMALDLIATDAAKVSIISKNDVQTTDPSKMPELIAARAKTLRSLAGSDPAFVASVLSDAQTDSPDRVFTTDASPELVGSMTGW